LSFWHQICFSPKNHPKCLFVLIFARIRLAKFKDEQIATMRAVADMTAQAQIIMIQAQIIMIIAPSARLVIDVNCAVWLPFSALIERHLGSIKKQAESENAKLRYQQVLTKYQRIS